MTIKNPGYGIYKNDELQDDMRIVINNVKKIPYGISLDKMCSSGKCKEKFKKGYSKKDLNDLIIN
jgi:hypothetical protein